MTRQQLEMFLSVAKHLSFTRAAGEFYTSQPTISRQINLLEEEWGFPLFIRNKKEVRLTPGGAIMMGKVKEALSLIDMGIHEYYEMKQGKSGELRIGCLESLDVSSLIVPTLSEFSMQNPNISISIERRSFSELRDKLEAGIYDVIFTYDFEMSNMNGVLCDTYSSIRAGILFSKKHPFAQKKEVHWDDFKNETFILPFPSESPGRKEELSKILGYSPAKILYVPNMESQALNVRAGNGVSLMDEGVLEVKDDEHYCFYPFPENMASLFLIYVWKKENLNPALTQYIGDLFLRKENLVR